MLNYIFINMEKTVNERVRLFRKSLDMSQGEFAKKLGMTQANLSLIEKGNRSVSLELLKKISTIYHVTVESLLQDVEKTTNSNNESTLQKENSFLKQEVERLWQLLLKGSGENFLRAPDLAASRSSRGMY